MRKIKFLLFSVLLAGAAFTSCSPDELLDVPEIDKPVITVFKVLDGQNVAITSINNTNTGEEMPVIVRFDMGAQKNRLERIKITTTIGTQSFVVLDSALNTGIFNRGDKMFERKYNIAVGQTISKMTFEAIDSKGVVGSTTVTITPKGSFSPDAERVKLSLAGQLNTTAPYGGFYSVATNKAYKLKDAVTNAQYVDFVYYYGATNEATLAPLQEIVVGTEPQPLTTLAGIKDYIGQFNVLNKTLFARATADNYTKGTMPTATLENRGQTKLVAGDCLAFKTVLGQRGIIRVVSVNGTNTTGIDRSITIDVKVIQ